MLNVYDFKDYREFLREFVSRQKQENPQWTIAGWARELGLLATTSLTKILNGQREPGEKICRKLVEYFRFDHDQIRYFDMLVRLNKCDDDHLKEVFQEKLMKLTPVPGKLFLDETRLEMISDWTHLAIRQLASVSPLPNDPEWIARQLVFEAPAAQVRRALDNLVVLGLLELKDGFFRMSQSWITTQEDIPSKALRSHHSQMIENAKKSIEMVPVEKRQICGSTMAIPLNKMESAKSLIRQFASDMAKLMDSPSCDQVYQLNVQFFPLTHEQKTQGEPS
jgi:uncharacterized protein (TIGR02147 family)